MTISKLPTSASLKEVMDKFEEIGLSDFSNIDVVVKSELPNEVKNNQIVIITNDDINNIYINSQESDMSKLNVGDVIIYNYTTSLDWYKTFKVSSINKNIITYVGEVFRKTTTGFEELDAYIGINGTWQKTNDKMIILDKNYVNESIGGLKLTKNAPNATVIEHTLEHRDDGIYSKLYFNYDNKGGFTIVTNKGINLSKFRTLELTYDGIQQSYRPGHSESNLIPLRINIIDSSNSTVATYKVDRNNFLGNNKLVSLDISNISSVCTIKVYSSHPGNIVEQLITKIELK